MTLHGLSIEVILCSFWTSLFPEPKRIIPNTAVFGPTNFIGTTTASTRMTVLRHGWQFIEDIEDFYGGRMRPLEKFYLFIYFLLMISDEDFYGGRTGPLEKFYLFIFFF